MSQLSKIYKKSGLRNIYEKNKSLILNTAGMAAALGGAGLVAPALLPTIMGTGGAGLLAGAAAAGGGRDKQRLSENNAADMVAMQERLKSEAGQRVDDTLRGITGDPNSPVTGPNPNPADPAQPVLPPQVNPGLIDQVVGDTPISGGAIDTGGQASKDQQQLLNEAELAYKLQKEQAGLSKAEREKMLKEYADLVTSQQNRLLDENNPAILEDLNRRGLLRSSELGNAMGRERAKAAAILQEQVGLQGLNDRESYIKSLEDANSGYLSGRAGGIQRRFSLEDFARQAQVAKDTGIALQPIQTGTPSSKAGDAAMVGAGANVVTALNGKGARK